ncbi:hypothetical protein ZIOFF_050091 [Zingiber officinale]|uniref:Protein kinase domain-containing protein n=1 Tax=Zingiber officinale TaxID=94328 RepID=A0A8J5FQK6_ZINOF|nr:hypothetical protein ZIOFF_050091 [Zingiber officinale]
MRRMIVEMRNCAPYAVVGCLLPLLSTRAGSALSISQSKSRRRGHVHDFRLEKLVTDNKMSMPTRVVGTFGYLAPEYATTGKVSTKVDVYTFGVILMEIIIGRKVLDESFLPDDNLVSVFRREFTQEKNKILNSMTE